MLCSITASLFYSQTILVYCAAPHASWISHRRYVGTFRLHGFTGRPPNRTGPCPQVQRVVDGPSLLGAAEERASNFCRALRLRLVHLLSDSCCLLELSCLSLSLLSVAPSHTLLYVPYCSLTPAFISKVGLLDFFLFTSCDLSLNPFSIDALVYT